MTKIADLLDQAKPIEEAVSINNDDPGTVFTEVTEYIVTDRIRGEYERLFSAMTAAVKSPNESAGVWISGFFGSGKTSFAKNLGHVLANREVLGASASSRFVRQAASKQVGEYVEFLNRRAPCEIFTLDAYIDLPPEANADQIAETMYSMVVRDLDYEDHERSKLSVRDLIEKLFHVCENCRPGKTFAFIVDEIDQYLALGGERLKNLRAVVEQFGKVSLERVKAGTMPGPAWIIVTAQQKLDAIDNSPEGNRNDVRELQERFKHQIDLSAAGIGEIAARRVLRKKESEESVLRKLFREHGAALNQSVKLEHCSRGTEFDENQFVQFYPYLPHLIDLSIEIGKRLHPSAPKRVSGGNRTIVKQCSAMLASKRTRLADQDPGVLVSIDKIYELVKGSIPVAKQDDIQIISERCDGNRYPGMAARVAKAICLMELANPELPRTAKNIAAVLVQHVTEAPPTLAVTTVLDQMRRASFVRESGEGWKFYDFDELHRAVAALEEFKQAVGKVNPRAPGWRNDVIQIVKKLLARVLNWYMRPLHAFNASVSRSLEEITGTLDALWMNMVVLQTQLAESEKRGTALEEQLELTRQQVKTLLSSQTAANQGAAPRIETDWSEAALENSPLHRDTGPKSYRTAYVVGLFGTGRIYVCELVQRNLGERAKYFRDTIRFHPCPTRMIYSGHATMKHVSRAQSAPAVTSRILEAVRAGFADLIFIYRHPLDSLLTNWIWWRTHIRDYRCISGISQVYENRDDLCVDLEQNFLEFKAFAEAEANFFANAAPGPRFLSFAEFVEETELYLQSAATLRLRLEDFMADPVKEFSKIVEVTSVDVELRGLDLARPRSKPYGYLSVQDKVPQFRNFIDELNAETKRRIERIGYNLGP